MSKLEKPIKITVFNIQQLEDVTDSLDYFELIESTIETYAWMTLNGERIGLCPKRICPVNNIYSIRLKDQNDIEVHRIMEVADEIQNQIPVHLDPITLHAKHSQDVVQD